MKPGPRVICCSGFSGLGAPPRYDFDEVILKHARDLVPNINPAGASRRMESAFDTISLPIISHSPHHANVLFLFSHFGLTLGAIGGKLIAKMAAGNAIRRRIRRLRRSSEA